MVSGIFGLCLLFPTLFLWFCGIFPLLLGLLAIILGFLGLSRAKRDPAAFGGRWLSIVGILVGAIAVVVPMLYGLLNIGLIAYRFS